jgi:hypothetical protein
MAKGLKSLKIVEKEPTRNPIEKYTGRGLADRVCFILFFALRPGQFHETMGKTCCADAFLIGWLHR